MRKIVKTKEVKPQETTNRCMYCNGNKSVRETTAPINEISNLISHVSDSLQIENADEAYDMALHAPHPVFYNGEQNQLIQVPNPYNVVIDRLMTEVSAIGADTIIGIALRNIKEGIYDDIMWSLRNLVNDVVKQTYANAIVNSVISFISNRLRDVQIANSDAIFERMVGSLISAREIEGRLWSIIDLQVDLMGQKNRKLISVEDANAIMLYRIFLMRDNIMALIAGGLNEMARSFAFGKDYCPEDLTNGYRNHTNSTIYGTSELVRREDLKDVLESVGYEIESENTSFEWFWILMCEMTAQLETISPLIEALLWQVVSAIEHIYNDDLIAFATKKNNYNDPF